MIQRIIFIGLITAFIGGAAITKALDCSDRVSETQPLSETRIISKAIQLNGELMPAIELPEVAVHAERSEELLVRATLVNGHPYPSYQLSTVTILPAD